MIFGDAMKILITILLLAAIYSSHYLVNRSVDRDDSVPRSNFSFAELSLETRQLNQFTDYRVIAEKPLFDQDREPPKVVAVKPNVIQKKAERQLMVQALGIAVSGETILAVVKDLRTGTITRLKVNEELEGWTLSGVSTDSFIFTKGDNEKIVNFKANGEPK